MHLPDEYDLSKLQDSRSNVGTEEPPPLLTLPWAFTSVYIQTVLKQTREWNRFKTNSPKISSSELSINNTMKLLFRLREMLNIQS